LRTGGGAQASADADLDADESRAQNDELIDCVQSVVKAEPPESSTMTVIPTRGATGEIDADHFRFKFWS
jgi:hypothetical protein